MKTIRVCVLYEAQVEDNLDVSQFSKETEERFDGEYFYIDNPAYSDESEGDSQVIFEHLNTVVFKTGTINTDNTHIMFL